MAPGHCGIRVPKKKHDRSWIEMASETCENIPPLKLLMLVPKLSKIGVTEETKLGSAIPTSSLFELLGVGKQEKSWKISPTTSLNLCPPMCQFTYAQDLNASHASLNQWWGLNALAHQDSCYRVRKPNELTMSFSWQCFICCEVGPVTWILSLFCSRSLLKCLMFTKERWRTEPRFPP